MAQRKKTFVSPAKPGGWDVKKGGKVISHHKTKENAVQKGMKIGRKDAPYGQLIIQKQNGKIEEERTYGNDPKRYKG